MVNRSYFHAPFELGRIWLEGWDQNVLIKIGHTANKKSERIEMEVTTTRRGWSDSCVSLSIILNLLGD